MGPTRLLWPLPILAAQPAWAHSAFPGLEGLYVGLIHPFSTPPQALLLLGLGLLAGGYRPAQARWFLPVFLGASLVGLLAPANAPLLDESLLALVALVALLAALAPGRGALLTLILMGLGGGLIGAASVPDGGPALDRAITMLGSLVGANLGLLYLFGVSFVIRDRYAAAWVGIAFRIILAWIGALSLILLALRFAPPLPPT